jgi:hypothetical protein
MAVSKASSSAAVMVCSASLPPSGEQLVECVEPLDQNTGALLKALLLDGMIEDKAWFAKE